jgi:glyoxylase-like metal-dependent hydrolase (beta-lactamase superfamily II)
MFIIKKFEFSPIQENTYLLYNEQKNCIIIDPGCYDDMEKSILSDFITENDLKAVLLLNTHCHLDHVFGNKYVFDTYQLMPHIHPLEKELLAYAPVSGLMYNLPFDNYEGEVNFLEEGQTIKLDEDELIVLFTPGHSPGSVSFYCNKQQFVISGDVLFKNSVGRTDLPGGNYEILIQSIKNQLLVLPSETKVYSGHGMMTTIGEESVFNSFIND